MNGSHLRNYVIIAIFACMVVVGTGFAAFSTGLEINGTATVAASSWNVHFADLQPVELNGDAEQVTAPAINGNTVIKTYNVLLVTPGDSASYTFDIRNEGTFDAKISAINIPTPTCVGDGDNATTDAENVCGKLEYTLTYVSGAGVTAGNTLAVGDTLAAGESVTAKLKLTYKDHSDATKLPVNDVTVENLGITMTYEQA